MVKLLGTLNLVVGWIFVILSIWALSGIPGAYVAISNEPEDLISLVTAFVVCAFAGAISIIAGLVLLLQRRIWKFTARRVSVLAALVAAVFLILVAMGYWLDEPGVQELRYLLIPAAVLTAAYVKLRAQGQ